MDEQDYAFRCGRCGATIILPTDENFPSCVGWMRIGDNTHKVHQEVTMVPMEVSEARP